MVKKIKLGTSELMLPNVVLGCMRLKELDDKQTEELVDKAIELGANFFEHADIYGAGSCEEQFGKLLAKKPSLRESITIQSKCGIVPGKMFDFSKEYIVSSVDGILKRLNTEYLDLLVLHRPDTLVEPSEVAEAFDSLQASGKVKHFGVSNHRPMQIELLKKEVKQPILVNQLQFGLAHAGMITSGFEANMQTAGASDRDGEVLDYCRVNDITIQAWSPFQMSGWRGVFLGNDEYKELNQKLEELAEKYGVTATGIATAWILRHPANMQVIAGTTKCERLEEIVNGSNVNLTREEWYSLYMSAGNILP